MHRTHNIRAEIPIRNQNTQTYRASALDSRIYIYKYIVYAKSIPPCLPIRVRAANRRQHTLRAAHSAKQLTKLFDYIVARSDGEL